MVEGGEVDIALVRRRCIREWEVFGWGWVGEWDLLPVIMEEGWAEGLMVAVVEEVRVDGRCESGRCRMIEKTFY